MSWSKRILTYAVSASLVLGVVPSLAHAAEQPVNAPELAVERVEGDTFNLTASGDFSQPNAPRFGYCDWVIPDKYPEGTPLADGTIDYSNFHSNAVFSTSSSYYRSASRLEGSSDQEAYVRDIKTLGLIPEDAIKPYCQYINLYIKDSDTQSVQMRVDISHIPRDTGLTLPDNNWHNLPRGGYTLKRVAFYDAGGNASVDRSWLLDDNLSYHKSLEEYKTLSQNKYSDIVQNIDTSKNYVADKYHEDTVLYAGIPVYTDNDKIVRGYGISRTDETQSYHLGGSFGSSPIIQVAAGTPDVPANLLKNPTFFAGNRSDFTPDGGGIYKKLDFSLNTEDLKSLVPIGTKLDQAPNSWSYSDSSSFDYKDIPIQTVDRLGAFRTLTLRVRVIATRLKPDTKSIDPVNAKLETGLSSYESPWESVVINRHLKEDSSLFEDPNVEDYDFSYPRSTNLKGDFLITPPNLITSSQLNGTTNEPSSYHPTAVKINITPLEGVVLDKSTLNVKLGTASFSSYIRKEWLPETHQLKDVTTSYVCDGVDKGAIPEDGSLPYCDEFIFNLDTTKDYTWGPHYKNAVLGRIITHTSYRPDDFDFGVKYKVSMLGTYQDKADSTTEVPIDNGRYYGTIQTSTKLYKFRAPEVATMRRSSAMYLTPTQDPWTLTDGARVEDNAVAGHHICYSNRIGDPPLCNSGPLLYVKSPDSKYNFSGNSVGPFENTITLVPMNAVETCKGVANWRGTDWCLIKDNRSDNPLDPNANILSSSAPDVFPFWFMTQFEHPEYYLWHTTEGYKVNDPDFYKWYWDNMDNKVAWDDEKSGLQPDVYDLDGDGDTTERNVMYHAMFRSISHPSDVITTFQVGKDGRYGANVTAPAGSAFDYRVSFRNYNSIPMQFNAVTDVFPTVGDNRPYNNILGNGTSSSFTPKLTGAPVIDGSFKDSASIQASEDGNTFVDSAQVSDWSKIKAMKIAINGNVDPKGDVVVTIPAVVPDGAEGVAVNRSIIHASAKDLNSPSSYINTPAYCTLVTASYQHSPDFVATEDHSSFSNYVPTWPWPIRLVNEQGETVNQIDAIGEGGIPVSLCTFKTGTYHIEVDAPKGLGQVPDNMLDASTLRTTDFKLEDEGAQPVSNLSLADPTYDKVVPVGSTLEIDRPSGFTYTEGAGALPVSDDGTKWVFRNTCEAQDSADTSFQGKGTFGETIREILVKMHIVPAPHQDKDCASFQPTSTVSATQGTSTETQLVADDPSKIESITYAVDGQSWVTTQDGKAVVAPGYDVAPGDYTIKATVTYKDGSTSESSIPVKVVAAPVSVSKLTVKQGQSASQDINVPGNPALSLAPTTDAAFTVDGNTLVAAPTCSTTPGDMKVVMNATFASTGYVRAVEVPVTVTAASQAECAHIATDLPEVGARQGEETSTDFPVGDGDEVSTNVPWVRYEDGKLIAAPGYDVKPGTYPVVVTVKHPDGSTTVSTLPVKVEGVSYTLPEGTSVEVRQGETEELPLDLPDGASLATVQPGWVTIDGNKLVFQPVCGTPVGDGDTTVGIVYADGRKGSVVVPTKVLAAPQANCTDPVAPVDLVLTQGKRTEVDLKVAPGATVSLPEGTPEWVKVEGNKLVITPPEDLTPGHYTFTADVTYEDGSKDTVSFKAYVEKLTKVVEIPEIPEPQPPVTTVVPPAPSAPSVKVESEGSSPWNWLWVIPAVLGLATVVSYWQYINQVDGGDRYPLVRGQANPADWIRWIQGLPARESGGLR